MSTKAIREALEWMRSDGCTTSKAMAELEAIETERADAVSEVADLKKEIRRLSHRCEDLAQEVQAGRMALEKAPRLEKAAALAFDYIGDRSAGSSEAWASLAAALGMDEDDAGASEMVGHLKRLAKDATPKEVAPEPHRE